MFFNIYSAGTRKTRKLISTAATFKDAMRTYETEATAWLIVPAGEAQELEPLGNLVGINPRYGTSGVYLIGAGEGFSCLGFDVAERKRAAVFEWLQSEGATRPAAKIILDRGSPAAFARYLETMAAGQAYHAATGRRCPAELTPQLAPYEGKQVEVTDCHGETRRFHVGKSTGWLPIHLEIESRRSHGGVGVYGAPFQSVRLIGA